MTDNKQSSGLGKMLKGIGLAGTAAVITVTGIHPIDVVKTRLQIQGEAGRQTKQYNGVSGVIKSVLADEGAAAFYKGKFNRQFARFNLGHNIFLGTSLTM